MKNRGFSIIELAAVISAYIAVMLFGNLNIKAQTGIEPQHRVGLTELESPILSSIHRFNPGSGVSTARIGTLLVRTATIGTAGATISKGDSSIAYQAFKNTAWFLRSSDSVQIDGWWGYQVDTSDCVWHHYGTMTLNGAIDTLWYWSSLEKCKHIKISATTLRDSSGDTTWVSGKLLRDNF